MEVKYLDGSIPLTIVAALSLPTAISYTWIIAHPLALFASKFKWSVTKSIKKNSSRDKP